MRRGQIYISVGIVLSLVWLITMTRLLYDFNVLSSDSVMYALPIAVMQHPFHFGIPYLNNFMGYGENWGHHWPGALWIKAVIFSIIPYKQSIDILYNLLLLLITGLLTGWIVRKTTGNRFLSILSVVLVCSDRIIIGSIGFMRIEIVGIFAITLLQALSALSYERRNNNLGLAVGFIGASMAAACHPYSMVLAAVFIAVYGALSILQYKALDKSFCVLSAGFILGIVSFWLWLSLQPECLSQFVTNLHLQKSFYQNYSSVYEGLKYNYRFGIGLILWGAALVGVIYLTLGIWLKRPFDLTLGNKTIIITSILFLTLCVVHTVTKCENFYYLGFGAPLIAIILSESESRLNQGYSKWIGKISLMSFGLLVILSFSLLPLRLYNYYSAGFPSIINLKKSLLASIPAQSTVFIPPDYWNVAYSDPNHNFKFWTFCVASSYSKRHDYETQAYRDLNNNSFLIVNEIGLGQPDKFGIGPTFNVSPPDPDYWIVFNRLEKIFPGKIPWGFNYAVYRHK